MARYITPPPGNPLTQALTAVVAVIVLAGAIMLGLVALAVAAGLGLLVWLGIWLRVAWLKRRFGKSPTGAGEEVIEAEYTVISRRRDA